MAFSMHSHSGQFCPGHAKDSLEEVIQTAISRGMRSFALTEHMPRNSDKDLYPEEITGGHTISLLAPRHEAFIVEALRLQARYASQIKLLIGFEGEFIRKDYAPLIQTLASNPAVDFFIGSVHHVHEIPIDYNVEMYNKAKEAAGGTDERLYEDYFDLQYEMLKETRPKVVGHFDLIRLLAPEPNRDLKTMKSVWEKAKRNLEFMKEIGALMEVNSAGLRKGLEEPYPTRSVCEEYLALGGKLTLSDDSHGIMQVGTNYERTFEYVESLGVKELWVLEEKVSLEEIKQSFKAKSTV